ncbi:MAG TPA: hypothetical protein VGM41_16610 [Chitinophagaceae bacterium]|jgi:hypothetical protein
MPKIDFIQKRYTWYVGIDTGVNTGLAVWCGESKRLSSVKTVKIHNALDAVRRLIEDYPGKVVVRVEDARLRTWIPREATESAERGRREGAGSVKRDCSIWEDFLEDLWVDYQLVAPKNNKTKVKEAYFHSLTKWEERTSGHARDAAMLVYGM